MTSFKIVVGSFCVAWIFKQVLMPLSAAAFYSQEYMHLVVECDVAMESAWYGDSNHDSESKAQEIHLLDCHEYDKARKKMLFLGLPETYLSWLGLRSLEIYQRPAREFTEAHRFRER
ncbi:TIGR03982 family His-Xaa-Ser system protein [Porticoccaceae bacterium]|nr:TIGR03982 family His-Xaa-Ser system protein [Porticoccaceae bacterium]